MTNKTMPRPPPKLHINNRPARPGRCLLLVVEGVNDVAFLRRISRILHCSDASLPDLEYLERARRIVFLPFGGGNVAAWATRLEPLGCPELHLYDREIGAETRYRIATAKRVNARPNCQAFVMAKRSLENYLHPQALQLAVGIDLQFDDHDSVAGLVAKERFTGEEPFVEWDALSRRAKKRLGNHAKRWLNTQVVDAMTPELLSDRDPRGEVINWMRAVVTLTR
ncbi:MAG TPA: ATP-dependent endonuclease [Pirellulaceae bacterium]|nr:ATP-dependent endonuclease [Pirellulaceae bacterium]